MPLDNQMICNIQTIASRLAAKFSQLLGMLSRDPVYEITYLIPILQEIYNKLSRRIYAHTQQI